MASRRHNGSSSSTSSRNFGLVSPKLKCMCGLEAITRTVKNGENVGLKFHGCPRCPDGDCGFFEWANVYPKDVDDLQLQVFERDTLVAEKEMEIDFLKEQPKMVEKKLGNNEDELDDTKMELCHTRIELMKATGNEKNFSIALLVSWIFFAFMIVILKA
uniref:GRF-type domain-containing protein n=1 Tax=Chenopodium quinoa TaxID=63459 RepID=A0A803MTA2_CHEQI